MHSLISLVERVRDAFITVIYKWRTKHARVPRRAAAVCIEFCRCFEVVHGSNSRQTGNIDAGNLRDHTDLIKESFRDHLNFSGTISTFKGPSQLLRDQCDSNKEHKIGGSPVATTLPMQPRRDCSLP